MKKLINISLILLFTMTFVACEKERILPIGLEDNNEQCDEICGFDDFENLGDGTKSSGDAGDGSLEDAVTDPDEDEDFEGEDKVTDPDEDEDFESEDLD